MVQASEYDSIIRFDSEEYAIREPQDPCTSYVVHDDRKLKRIMFDSSDCLVDAL